MQLKQQKIGGVKIKKYHMYISIPSLCHNTQN